MIELLQTLIFLGLALVMMAMLPGIIGCLFLALVQPAKRTQRIVQSGAFFVSGVSATMLIAEVFHGGRMGGMPYERWQTRHCQANLEQIVNAVELYTLDNQGKCPTALDKLVPKYLKSLPVCPVAGVDTYSRSFAAYRGVYSGQGVDLREAVAPPRQAESFAHEAKATSYSPLQKQPVLDIYSVSCQGDNHTAGIYDPHYSSQRGFSYRR